MRPDAAFSMGPEPKAVLTRRLGDKVRIPWKPYQYYKFPVNMIVLELEKQHPHPS